MSKEPHQGQADKVTNRVLDKLRLLSSPDGKDSIVLGFAPNLFPIYSWSVAPARPTHFAVGRNRSYRY